jgi:SDR family mycofactocin-dependent oxidoreductase
MGIFSGQVALITGGARGQGRSHAQLLAAEGADVVLVDSVKDNATAKYSMASVDDLNQTVDLVRATGQCCTAFQIDVRDVGGMQRVADETVREFGRIDILLANAGILTFGALSEMDGETWRETIDINLTGVFNAMRAVLPHMISRQYGRVIATSSAVGHMGMENVGHYAASKWGILGLVKSAALEVAAYGITVNAVTPTMVNTPMIMNGECIRWFVPGVANPTDEQIRAAFTLNPMKVPWMEPIDVSRVVRFLASPDSKYITGESIGPIAGAGAQNGAA